MVMCGSTCEHDVGGFWQAVVDSILAEVAHINKALVTELQNDLFVLISKHPFIQVGLPRCQHSLASRNHLRSRRDLRASQQTRQS